MELLKKYPQLIKNIAEHNSLFFLGAGVSKFAGMPDAVELSNILGQDLLQHFTKTKQLDQLDKIEQNLHILDEIAKYYFNIFGENSLKNKIAEIIELTQRKANPSIFEKITLIPRNDIITTNFDTLLESKFSSLKDISVIWEDKHLINNHPLKYNIFKIHGTYQDSTSIKILKEDYAKFKKTEVYKFLFSLFKTKTLIIVGYSLNDSDFHDIFEESISVWPNVEIYLVIQNFDPLIHTSWQKRGARIIEGGADSFFTDLVDSVYTYTQEALPEEIQTVPKGEIKKEDQNPFKFYTTDGLNPDQFIELYHTFVPPEYSDFVKLYSIDKHHILQSGRGTGKTVILRGLSIENLLINNIKTNFVGFWIPFSTSFLGCVKRESDDTDNEYYKFFASYLAILTVEKICVILTECKDKNHLFFEKANEEKFVSAVLNDLKIVNENADIPTLTNEIIAIRSEYHTAYDRKSFHIKDPLYLRTFLKRLSILHDYFKEKYFFIVLDDVHFMDLNQKKVLISFLSHREYPLSFKIGTSREFGVYTDFFGATIQEGKDYETVYLDRVFGKKGFEDYKKFLENLANIRLETFKQTITIKELLPQGERKKGEYYNGFDVYAILSSQIIRDYITLVKDTIYYAYPQISTQYVKLEPIPPNVQNDVIYTKSSIHLKDIDAAGDLRKDVLLLIETLGKLFKQILEKSKQISPNKEIRTAAGIDIKNFHNLDPRIEAALNKAVELQLLQIPFYFRIRQKTETPLFGVKFHKLLIPYFRLKLGYRYPRQVEASALNRIFDSPEKFVADLTKTLEENEPESDAAQMEIEYLVT